MNWKLSNIFTMLILLIALVFISWYLFRDRSDTSSGLPNFPAATVIPDEAKYDIKIYHETFLITLAEGNGADGYDYLKITSFGSCEYVYAVRSRSTTNPSVNTVTWKRATFVVDLSIIDGLRKCLDETNFLSLDKVYRARVQDGTQRIVIIEGSGKTKIVSCSNSFPKPVLRLFEFMKEAILNPNRKTIQAGMDVSPPFSEFQKWNTSN